MECEKSEEGVDKGEGKGCVKATMVAIEDGDALVPLKEDSIGDCGQTVMERCLDQPRKYMLNVLTFCLAMGNAADAVEIMCIGFIMTELNLSSEEKEFLSAAVYFGMFFGGIFCGLLSDRFGRKPCLLYSLALNAIAGVASAFVPNVRLLIVCRVIGGIGIGGSVPAVFSLGAELFPPSVRGKLLSLVASFWMVGAIFVAGVGWIMLGEKSPGVKMIPGSNWRWFAGVCSLPAFIAFLLTIFCLPESPRYLIEKQNFDDAADVLNRLSVVQTTSQELKIEYYMNKSDDEMFDESKTAKKAPSVLTIFSIKKLRRISSTLMVIWFTLSFGSYGIITWINSIFKDVGETNLYKDSFIFALANLPGNLISILLVDKYGRKNLLFYGMLLAGLFSIGFAVEKKNKNLVVLCAALFNASSVIGWNSLDCLSVELFPTAVRTSAMGILTGSGRIGAVTAQFVNGSLEANVGVLLFVTSTCMIVGGAFVFCLPDDPSGSNLDDSIEESPGNINRRSELLTPDLGPGEERDQLSPKTSEFYPSKPKVSQKNPSEKKRKQKNGPDKTYNVVPLSDQGQ